MIADYSVNSFKQLYKKTPTTPEALAEAFLCKVGNNFQKCVQKQGI